MNSVHIVFGPLGAGKSTLARKLSAKLTGVRFSIDEWMFRLYGPDLPQPMNLAWVLTRVQRCEAQMWEMCLQVLDSGRDVVLDQGFMTEADRARVRLLAGQSGYQVSSYFIDADLQLRRERVMRRNTEKGETYAFEVTGPMFDAMEARFERPSPKELEQCCHV
ncbi:AAA family ATPase [Pseudomonas kilonensis]